MEGALPSPFRLVALDRVDSTNDETRRRAEQGAGGYLVIQSREQTAGRGRRGRAWISSSGNLHCSILLAAAEDFATAPQLAFVAAVALRESLAELVPAAAFTCKWPNDILCGGRKIAGMLLEAAPPHVILGVGVDVELAPDPALYPTTCLRRVGSAADSMDVLRCFCDHLGPWYDRWRQGDFVAIRQAWLDHAAGIGGPVTVRLADGKNMQGRFAGLDGGGALLLAGDDGAVQPILAGDVFFTA